MSSQITISHSQAQASENIVWHETAIQKNDRQRLNGHQSAILWFTGLSGSGKSTLANALEQKLHERHIHSYVLDGDNVRHGLNKGLGFNDADRTENIRRVGEAAKLFVDAGLITMTAFISPFRQDRQAVRELVDENEFIEIYVKCPLDECENRDTKGLYKKARAGLIPDFTGIDSPYEEPQQAEIVVETNKNSVAESVTIIIEYLTKNELI